MSLTVTEPREPNFQVVCKLCRPGLAVLLLSRVHVLQYVCRNHVTCCVPNATIYQHPNQRLEELIVHSLRGEPGLSDGVEKSLNTARDLCKPPLCLAATFSIMSTSYIYFHLDSSSYPAWDSELVAQKAATPLPVLACDCSESHQAGLTVLLSKLHVIWSTKYPYLSSSVSLSVSPMGPCLSLLCSNLLPNYISLIHIWLAHYTFLKIYYMYNICG